MKWYYNLKVGAKLISGFIIVAMIAGIVGIVGYSGMSEIKKAEEEIAIVRLPSIQSLLIMSEAQTAVLVGERGLTNNKMMNEDIRKAQYAYIESAFIRADEARKTYLPLPMSAEEEVKWEEFVPKWDKWVSDHNIVIEFAKEKDKLLKSGLTLESPEIKELDGKEYQASLNARTTFLAAEAVLNEIVDINIEIAHQSEIEANVASERANIILIVVIVAAIVISILLGLFISTIIKRPINKAVLMMKEMSMGHLGLRLNIDTKDEIGQMAIAMDGFADDLQNIVIATMKQISDGDMSAVVVQKDDKDEISPALKMTIDAIKALIDETNILSQAAIAGKLNTRGDSDKFKGGYKNIIEGVNQTLDAIIKPVQEAAAVLKEMSNGNLQVSVTGDYKGDHADIKNALNETIESLSQVLSDINSASEQVASGSRQVSVSSMSLSQGATEQASSIEELTASVEEIASQTRQNAGNANQANDISETAKTNASEGNEQMKKMLKAMDEINESSSNISKIIKVIDEIAFQTNILALNAAVEAARAGQHGKGFAVVAEEVRNLAARSANAAKETTVMIEGSIKKVEDGTKIANQTANALTNIVEGISKVANLVNQIAVASNEQALGVDQVNQGLTQISEVVQTTSATSEETAAASEELSGQAEMLKKQVEKFKLKKLNGNGSYKGLESLNPEVIKMLESMNSKNYNHGNQDEYNEVAVTTNSKKISLSDKEFGKY
ncbi:MAG: methyl-accepting chemotaxis protein [Firmicutes bacterium HGW-Firmicutes-1]|jgi:methyl-accepting chemotaxis protein|nr:MAG: methyl-accepting chemotaxis protein [Firmicutes bacterium HGW-Firmicutes-1]